MIYSKGKILNYISIPFIFLYTDSVTAYISFTSSYNHLCDSDIFVDNTRNRSDLPVDEFSKNLTKLILNFDRISTPLNNVRASGEAHVQPSYSVLGKTNYDQTRFIGSSPFLDQYPVLNFRHTSISASFQLSQVQTFIPTFLHVISSSEPQNQIPTLIPSLSLPQTRSVIPTRLPVPLTQMHISEAQSAQTSFSTRVHITIKFNSTSTTTTNTPTLTLPSNNPTKAVTDKTLTLAATAKVTTSTATTSTATSAVTFDTLTSYGTNNTPTLAVANISPRSSKTTNVPTSAAKINIPTSTEIINITTSSAYSTTTSPINTLEQKIYPRFRSCVTRELKTKFEQRGEFWILQNYIKATKRFKCDESITYTTHGEYEFLDNLVPITSRWQGPVSVAVYAPGEDFDSALKTILYLRECSSKDVKDYVTFHILFDMKHFPKKIPTTYELEQMEVICSQNISFSNPISYRHKHGLLYPINVVRNVARINAATYFNSPLDIELYPSSNIIQGFFNMLQQPDVSDTSKKRVYVLPTFEVEEDQEPPQSKEQLLKMLQEKRAYVFHENICLDCHFVPKYEDWLEARIDPELSVFHIGPKRLHFIWEPFYIGTEEEPLFEERLTWEGRGDKMSQAYIMCLLDYEFHTLDNAFLIHRPGIQLPNPNHKTDQAVIDQRDFIFYRLPIEYQKLYGQKTRKECQIMGSH